jgi:pimeloyl-ACP methyl ester carboxylesterase
MTIRHRLSRLRPFAGIAAALMIALAVVQLESPRQGIERTDFAVGETPATLYAAPEADGPLVVIAHGFAGSRQFMEAISLTLARGGYRAVAFDFLGHGRNPVPMGGDVDAIEGTTQLLIDQTRDVIAAGLARTGATGPVALVGHSMASDIVIRTALADDRVGPVAAISMFSLAVTAERPERLLMVTGAWEPPLRQVALDRLRMVDPDGEEGDTVRAGETVRRAVVAPMVEHVGVLYSPTTLGEIRAWLDAGYGRQSGEASLARTGGWIALLLFAIPFLGWSLAALIPDSARAEPVPRRTWWLAVLVPAIVAPLVATRVDTGLLPVLVADYVALHLLIQGGLQILILWRSGHRFGPLRPVAALALAAFGIGVFGLALDRYAASFVLTGPRLPVFAAIAAGTVAFMIADAQITEAGRAALWRRLAARGIFLASLMGAVALDFERLMFLVIILPVIVIFYLIFGLMGHWVGLRAGPLASGLALGLILAWSLAASFPLFTA